LTKLTLSDSASHDRRGGLAVVKDASQGVFKGRPSQATGYGSLAPAQRVLGIRDSRDALAKRAAKRLQAAISFSKVSNQVQTLYIRNAPTHSAMGLSHPF
jgi:hypothetical protein